MGNEVDFLLADKHKSFLQDNGITLGVRSQTCRKYRKQQVYKDEVDFLSADKC